MGDLDCAENVATDLLRRHETLGMRVRNIANEVSVAGHLREVRASLRVTEERLREEQDQRLAEIAVDLATENVELRWMVLVEGKSVHSNLTHT